MYTKLQSRRQRENFTFTFAACITLSLSLYIYIIFHSYFRWTSLVNACHGKDNKFYSPYANEIYTGLLIWHCDIFLHNLPQKTMRCFHHCKYE
jgi:hypothetical protein